jgi:hypothetical protein
MGGITPAFLGVVNVYRAGQKEEVLGVHDHAIPCRQFHLLGEGSRLRVAPVEVEDLEFQFAFHCIPPDKLQIRGESPPHLSESTASESCHDSGRFVPFGLSRDRGAVDDHPALDRLVRERERIREMR